MSTKGKTEVAVVIQPLLQGIAVFGIEGTAPLVQHRFSEKVRRKMEETQAAGARAKAKRQRDPKDFDDCYEEATHKLADGTGFGVPASVFRSAMIDACRTAGYVMTRAKQAILWIEADGDSEDGTPLVRIVGDREKRVDRVRNDNGSVDVRARPMWRSWSATVRVCYDGDMLSETDVANLLMRAGAQVGIQEGRPASKKSHGVGWGTFRIAEKAR